jgi:3-oxoacyl-[acyl-carrier protein] reductase
MTTSPYDLTEKVAIVIGATKGMGVTISEQLVDCGASVVVSSRTAADAHAQADALNERGKGRAVAAPGDMTVKADLERIVGSAIDVFGRLTTLVLSPTIRPWFGPTLQMPDHEVDTQYEYVFRSRFWATMLAVPHLVDAGGGSIVYIGSGSPGEATAERCVYAAMRAAEIQLMKNVAAEFGPSGVRCNLISPGLIDANGSKALFEDPAAVVAATSAFPLRRHGTTTEIASTVTFLVSDASAYTTGGVIPVDGGRSIHAKPPSLGAAFAAEQAERMAANAPREG